MKLLWSNVLESAATLSATSEAGDLVAANLLTESRGQVWRSTSPLAQVIEATWPEPQIAGGMAAIGHNLSAIGTRRLQLFSDDAFSDLAYDSGAAELTPGLLLGDYGMMWGVWPLGRTLYDDWRERYGWLWFTGVAFRSMRLTLDDPASTDGYLQMASLMLGLVFEPTYRSIGLGAKYNRPPLATQVRMRSGSLRSTRAYSPRRLEVQLPLLEEVDRAALAEIGRINETQRRMFVSLFDDRGGAKMRDHAGPVKFAEDPGITLSKPTRSDAALVLTEA